MKRVRMLFLSGLAAAVAAGACGKAPPPPAPAPQPNADSIAAAEKARQDSIAAAQAAQQARDEAERVARQRAADSAAAASRTTEEVRSVLTSMIHFDFDKSNIRPEDAQILDQKTPILQANANAHILVAGNCDERGSDEYNLALGNRRALAAKEYLVNHGIDAGRIETVSYGKERPLDPGHTEQAWAMNRNDQFSITSGGDVLVKPQ